MDFEPSDKVKRLSARLREFMEAHIYPAEKVFERQMAEARDRWQVPPIMEELKAKARAAGLWNLFLPESEHGAGPDQPRVRAAVRDHGPLADRRRRSFNCSAPDTGNMEVLERYGTDGAARSSGSKPLLDGEIRSCLRDDRAGRRLVGRDQHRVAASSATATTTSSTAASGGRPAPATRAARSSSSWARPTRTRRGTSSSR